MASNFQETPRIFLTSHLRRKTSISRKKTQIKELEEF